MKATLSDIEFWAEVERKRAAMEVKWEKKLREKYPKKDLSDIFSDLSFEDLCLLELE